VGVNVMVHRKDSKATVRQTGGFLAGKRQYRPTRWFGSKSVRDAGVHHI